MSLLRFEDICKFYLFCKELDIQTIIYQASRFYAVAFFSEETMKEIKLVIDNDALSRYEKHYFMLHPKASKKPIDSPWHPTINAWMVMKRPQMNATKQKWKDFICWFVEEQGCANLHIEKCEMKFTTYYKTNRRHDVDNSCPKFILDGMSEIGLIVDDDSKHVTSLTLECYVDPQNPRTEILIKCL